MRYILMTRNRSSAIWFSSTWLTPVQDFAGTLFTGSTDCMDRPKAMELCVARTIQRRGSYDETLMPLERLTL